MAHLAMFTRQREIAALEEHGVDRVSFVFHPTDETLLLGCVFDWFSISLVSYLRVVKLIHLMELNQWNISDLRRNPVKEELGAGCVAYVKSVAPEVYQWRNKIAAHRAATDPRSDNLTTLTYSTLPTVTYQSPYYGVGYMRLGMKGGGTLDITPWSLTERHEALAPRYWPHRELPKLNLLGASPHGPDAR